jgi:hypothetical protein
VAGTQATAEFLLTRGPYAWIGFFDWQSLANWPRPPEWDKDFGVPAGPCAETGKGTGVFTRSWSKATVSWDCNAAAGTIKMMKTDDTAAPTRFHIGAAVGPGYQAQSWFPSQVPGNAADTPQVWRLLEKALRDYAAANFTLVDGGPPMHAVAPTNASAKALSTFLRLCKDTGLLSMPGSEFDGGKITAAEQGSVGGYGPGDEPGPIAFPGPANMSSQVKKLRPTKPQFINLSPIYGCSHGADGSYNNSWAPAATDCVAQYEAYVDKFASEVLPSMGPGTPLCFDHYPHFALGDGDVNFTDWLYPAAKTGALTTYRALLILAQVPALGVLPLAVVCGRGERSARMACMGPDCPGQLARRSVIVSRKQRSSQGQGAPRSDALFGAPQ